jgi:hypothetical protein
MEDVFLGLLSGGEEERGREGGRERGDERKYGEERRGEEGRRRKLSLLRGWSAVHALKVILCHIYVISCKIHLSVLMYTSSHGDTKQSAAM